MKNEAIICWGMLVCAGLALGTAPAACAVECVQPTLYEHVMQVPARIQMSLEAIVYRDARRAFFRKEWTPLQLASNDGDANSVRELIRNGADVNAVDSFHHRPLYLAARNGHTDVIELLIAAGASVDATTANGFTALHTAAYYGDEDVVRQLLCAGANVNALDSLGRPPLYWALMGTYTEVAAMLIDGGAHTYCQEQLDSFLHYWNGLKRGERIVAYWIRAYPIQSALDSWLSAGQQR
ncbi:MAG TPA: ankyrin repeat domain-containing protein [Opitutales bacterium]|nr:ankyrin repeat domain-containing protein [Opitutales bacterium]